MDIPRLVVNPSHKFPDEFYQITNISEDKTHFDFMGFKQLSVNNLWAANIIRDRTRMDYYDNLDYELTSDDIDEQDIVCIAEGIVEEKYELSSIPNDIIPTRPPLKKLNWEELVSLSKGEDMTREEIDQYVMETYRLDYKSIIKDNEIVKRHEFIAEQLEKMNSQENVSLELTKKDFEEIEKKKVSDEGKISAQEQIEEYKKNVQQNIEQDTKIDIPKESNCLKNIDLFDEIDASDIKESIIKDAGPTSDVSNYISFTVFFTKILGKEKFEENKEIIKNIVKNTSMTLNIGFKNKRVYKGVLKFIALELSNRGMLEKKLFGEDVDQLLCE